VDDSDRLDFLDGLQQTGIRPGLGRTRALMARLGHPERAFPSVLITGTNGKGSTAAFLESILRVAGYRTGLFTSPHLLEVRERIRIDGEQVDRETFAALGAEVRAAMDRGPRRVRATFFEALTGIGFLAFARAGVDLAVVEVGMGGRWDSTNVLDPVVSVLTHVSLDHQKYLGDTDEAIAAEKVAIARPGRAFVTGVSDRLFGAVVGPALDRIGARAVRADRDFRAFETPDGLSWRGWRREFGGVRRSLRGLFQVDNAGLALAAAEALEDAGFPIGVRAMQAGLETTVWPGRMQRVREAPDVILDGMHNPGAAEALAGTIEQCAFRSPLVLVHSSREDKDFPAVLRRMVPLFDRVIETTIPGLCPVERLVEAAQAAGNVPVEGVESLSEAVRRAMVAAGPGGTVLVAGSLYLVGAALATRPWEDVECPGS
jgi:dihydrofolate synthase/folylpolyglutamate synthase